MIPGLIAVEAKNKYVLHVRFSDGLAGTIDLSILAGKGIFKMWDEDDLFYRPYISEMGSISWNENIDIDAANAYLKVRGITFDEWQERSVQHATN